MYSSCCSQHPPAYKLPAQRMRKHTDPLMLDFLHIMVAQGAGVSANASSSVRSEVVFEIVLVQRLPLCRT